MIEHFYQVKIIRDFLNLFSQQKWKSLLTNVLQIGILQLKNNCNLTTLSFDDISNLVETLKKKGPTTSNNSNNYNNSKNTNNTNVPSVPKKEEIARKEINDNNIRSKSDNRVVSEPNNNKQSGNNAKINNFKPITIQKSSTKWRKGDDVCFNPRQKKYSKSPVQKSSKKHDINDIDDDDTESLNSIVYPKWWGGDKEEFKVSKQQIKYLKKKEKELQSQSYINPESQYNVNPNINPNFNQNVNQNVNTNINQNVNPNVKSNYHFQNQQMESFAEHPEDQENSINYAKFNNNPNLFNNYNQEFKPNKYEERIQKDNSSTNNLKNFKSDQDIYVGKPSKHKNNKFKNVFFLF